MFLDSHRTAFVNISQIILFARCCTSILDFHSKIDYRQITSKLLTQAYRYIKLKTHGEFFVSYSELLSKFGEKSFEEYVFEGISHRSSTVV